MKLCKVDGCDRKRTALGLCHKHYHRKRNGISLTAKGRYERTLEERFNEKVDKGESYLLWQDCWLWTASKNEYGYGKIMADGKVKHAHRVAYELYVAPIPDGMLVCHHCDNPSCVNPEHLYIGSHSENIQDRDERGRTQRGETHVRAKLTEVDVLKIRSLCKVRTRRRLGKMFGVSYGTISCVINRQTWKHI